MTDAPVIRAKPTAPFPYNKVLILEDDTALRETIAAFLTENGFEVSAVRDGVEGVSQVLENDFEVVLCDLTMPTLTGDMFYRAVGRLRPSLCNRFIFMTGRSDQGCKKMVGFFRAPVLSKPFHLHDLLDYIAFARVRTIQLAA